VLRNFFLAVLCSCFLSGCSWGLFKQDHQLQPIQVGKSQLQVEVVSQPASLAAGLSNRDQIGSDGMLFILGKRQIAQFWMKEMKFDLDLIWIDQGKVVGVVEQVPHPQPSQQLANPNSFPIYSSQQPVEMVLELKSGDVQRYQIQVGDQVKIGK
jgi:uncharacterized protein